MITRTISALALLVLLAGCDPNDLPPNSLAPICKALYGPIRYNTYTKTSQRYAGPVLGMDLARRNAIGRRLGCWQ